MEPVDLLRELRRVKPTVVHFSGRGDPDGLCFPSAEGPRVVPTAAITEAFRTAGASVKLIVLNACYSEGQAEALRSHVDCVVGVGGALDDGVGRAFAIGFYGALGEHLSVATAYRQGRAAIGLMGLGAEPASSTRGAHPQLKVRDGVDADQLVLAHEPAAGRAAPDAARPVGLSYAEMRERTFPVGLRTLSFAALRARHRLFERKVLANVLDDLEEEGTALVVGLPGSGKTILAFQLAARLQETPERAQLAGLPVAYVTFPVVDTAALIAMLDAPCSLLLIIDDAHEDEDKAADLREEWLARCGDDRAGPHRKYLLFLSQPYRGDEDEHRTTNLFREYGRTNSLREDPDEVAAFVDHQWRAVHASAAPPEAIARVCGFTRGSLGVGALAVELYRQAVTGAEQFDEHAFEAALLREIWKRYGLLDDPEARRAARFAYFDIAIIPAAFGASDAERLRKVGFLVPHSRHAALSVCARVVGELQQRVAAFDDEKLGDDFCRYIAAAESNYAEVLTAVRRSGHFSLLSYVVNHALKAIKDRLAAEPSLDAIALALECILSCSRRAAQSVLDDVLQRRSLADLLYWNRRLAPAASVARFLNIATTVRRDLVADSPPKRETPEVGFIRQILLERTTRLLDASRICLSLARGSRSLARRLLASVIERRVVAIRIDETDGPELQDKLRFIALAAAVDRPTAQLLSKDLDPERFAAIARRQRRPVAARHALAAVEQVNRRVAQDVVRRVIEDPGFGEWVADLVKAPTHLYHLGLLILDVRYLSPRLASKLAAGLRPHLCTAIANDRRLAALGFMLTVLRRTHWPSAREVMSVVQSERLLGELLRTESNPLRVGLSLSAVVRIDRMAAFQAVEAIDASRWMVMVTRARNLYALAVLLRGLSDASRDPDAAIEKLLSDARIGKEIANLARRSRGIRALIAYADIVAVSCPLSNDTRRRLLKYVTPQQFETHLSDEYDLRLVGTGLRAYAVTFPDAAQRYALGLLRQPAANPFRRWDRVEDVTATAFLLSSALAVDGRLGTAIARRLHDPVNALRREPSPARQGELLHALARADPEKAAVLVEQLYKSDRFLDIVEATANLRELVAILEACRASNLPFYRRWYGPNTPRQIADKIKRELRDRLDEESSLTVIGRCLSLFNSLDVRLACELCDELNIDWIVEVGRRNNHVMQVVMFAATAAGVQRAGGGASEPRFRALHKMLHDETFAAQLDDIRTVRGVFHMIADLLRVAERLGDSGLTARAWTRMNHAAIRSNLEYTIDAVGCGMLALLLTRRQLAGSPQQELGRAAVQRIEKDVADVAPASALFALALSGAREDAIVQQDLVRRVVAETTGARLWQIGFANWLGQQRAQADGHDGGRPLISPAVLRSALPANHNPASLIADDCDRAGGNLELAFSLSCMHTLGVAAADVRMRPILARAVKRRQWEYRVDRVALLERATRPQAALAPMPLALPEVSRFMRELAPRLEALLPPGEEEDRDHPA